MGACLAGALEQQGVIAPPSSGGAAAEELHLLESRVEAAEDQHRGPPFAIGAAADEIGRQEPVVKRDRDRLDRGIEQPRRGLEALARAQIGVALARVLRLYIE